MAEFTFDDLSKLTDREIQVLLREVDQKDLVVGLSGATAAGRRKFLSNMSQRVAKFLSDEVDLLGEMRPDEVEVVQKRIVEQAEELARKGHLQLPGQKPSKAAVKARKARKPSKQYLAVKKRLVTDLDQRLDDVPIDQLDKLFRGMAEVARREGILALDPLEEGISDPFLQSAVRLMVDGTEPDLIADILETWLTSLEYQFKRRRQKVIEGIMSIQSGDNPAVVEHKLSVMF